jgi:2-(1,2-epoxy-1,2-dihydrophenyl)acetyl-CoA isomerase
MDFQRLIFSKERGVATITFNDPGSYNPLSRILVEELVPAIEACRDDDEIRAVILTGAGRAFCAGGDLQGAQEHINQGRNPSNYFLDLTKPFHRFVTDLRLLPKPVIAAVNGPAAGAGFSIALVCDLRIAAESSFFRQGYTSIALVPDGGWTTFLPAIVGLGLASELIFLDRRIEAQEALRLGLVHQVVPDAELMNTAREVAERLAAGPAYAFARAKALLNTSLLDRLEGQLERERLGVGDCAGTADFREGLAAFLEKRQPRFGTSR